MNRERIERTDSKKFKVIRINFREFLKNARKFNHFNQVKPSKNRRAYKLWINMCANNILNVL